jgi:hypothetical protein
MQLGMSFSNPIIESRQPLAGVDNPLLEHLLQDLVVGVSKGLGGLGPGNGVGAHVTGIGEHGLDARPELVNALFVSDTRPQGRPQLVSCCLVDAFDVIESLVGEILLNERVGLDEAEGDVDLQLGSLTTGS